MSFERIDRISEEVRREVDSILREDVRDPRVTGTWSITRADVTRDLRYAKIRISVLEDELRQPMLTALKNAAGFIRHELGRRLNLRYTPEVLFEIDNNIALWRAYRLGPGGRAASGRRRKGRKGRRIEGRGGR